MAVSRYSKSSYRSNPTGPRYSQGRAVSILRSIESAIALRTHATLCFALAPVSAQTPTPSTTTTPSTQTKKEINFSGTQYWSSTPKAFPVDPAHPDRIMAQSEIFGVRVNDSGDGPFNGASVHIVTVVFLGKILTEKDNTRVGQTKMGTK